MNQSMMIEGKVRESIYIVKTYRRHAAHQYDESPPMDTHDTTIGVSRPCGVA